MLSAETQFPTESVDPDLVAFPRRRSNRSDQGALGFHILLERRQIDEVGYLPSPLVVGKS